MLQWLRLAVWLLLSAAVSGEEVQCGVGYNYFCWNSTTHVYDDCLSCKIKNQQLKDNNELSIVAKYSNGSDAVIELVLFSGGDVTKLPKVINKNSNKQILQVRLEGTKTRVLNAQFFGNDTEHLIYFRSTKNDNLSVEASAFQNCTELEFLNLFDNGISSISPDAFRGLNKLVRLDLGGNQLFAINENWFDDLGNLELLDLSANRLTEVADYAFEKLPKLKELYLNYNKIEIVTRKMFQLNQQLEKIYLFNNDIKKIQSRSFAHLKLSTLNLLDNICTRKIFQNPKPEEISAALTACRPTICVIPLITNGFIINTEDNVIEAPGNDLDTFHSARVVCNENFTRFHEKETQADNVCLEEDWMSQQWPKCERVCSLQEIINLSISASCERHGRVFPCSGHLLPGTKATIRCQIGYQKPEGSFNSDLTCQEDGKWSHKAFQCQPISGNVTHSHIFPTLLTVKCPHHEISDPSISAFCERDSKEFDCREDLLPGIKVSIRCHFGYSTSVVDLEMTCQNDGKWSHEVFKCQPICGIVTEHSTPLLINGKVTNVTEVPWHVAIYQNGEQICGGTIVSERVVISAAHCFSDNIYFMHTFDVKTYKVAAGRIARGLKELNKLETQIRDLQEVKISRKYDGYATWLADIATIIIQGYFEYKPHIAPACLKFSEDPSEKYPKNGTFVVVAGWGLTKDTKNFQSSETLLSFEIPVLDLATCREEARKFNFQAKVIADKICAGFVDGDYSRLVCKGDSGGGLLVPQMVDGEKRYFLQGVVSNSRQTITCDDTFYALFTNVQHYKNFLNEGIKKGATSWDEMVTVTPPMTVTFLVTTPVMITPSVTQPLPVERTWLEKTGDFFKNRF